MLFARLPQRFFAVGRGFDGVALTLQQIAERAQDVRLVVDDEDWPRHVALQQELTRGLGWVVLPREAAGRVLEHGVVQLLFMVLLRKFQAVNAAPMAALTTSGAI